MSSEGGTIESNKPLERTFGNSLCSNWLLNSLDGGSAANVAEPWKF
jgi:hypothetical protein